MNTVVRNSSRLIPSKPSDSVRINVSLKLEPWMYGNLCQAAVQLGCTPELAFVRWFEAGANCGPTGWADGFTDWINNLETAEVEPEAPATPEAPKTPKSQIEKHNDIGYCALSIAEKTVALAASVHYMEEFNHCELQGSKSLNKHFQAIVGLSDDLYQLGPQIWDMASEL